MGGAGGCVDVDLAPDRLRRDAARGRCARERDAGWRYRVHRWKISDDAVYTRSGWFTQESRVAPIARVQAIDSRCGLLHRMMRLTSVTVTRMFRFQVVHVGARASGGNHGGDRLAGFSISRPSPTMLHVSYGLLRTRQTSIDETDAGPACGTVVFAAPGGRQDRSDHDRSTPANDPCPPCCCLQGPEPRLSEWLAWFSAPRIRGAARSLGTAPEPGFGATREQEFSCSAWRSSPGDSYRTNSSMPPSGWCSLCSCRLWCRARSSSDARIWSPWSPRRRLAPRNTPFPTCRQTRRGTWSRPCSPDPPLACMRGDHQHDRLP